MLQFSNKNVHIWDLFFPLLFPKDSESVKILDIRLREVGAKWPLKKTENRRRSKKSEKSGEKKLFFVTRFSTIFKQKCSNVRPLLSSTFPQGFRISKNYGHKTVIEASQDGWVSVPVPPVTQCLLHTSLVNLNFGRIDNIQDIELHIIFPIVMP